MLVYNIMKIISDALLIGSINIWTEIVDTNNQRKIFHYVMKQSEMEYIGELEITTVNYIEKVLL